MIRHIWQGKSPSQKKISSIPSSKISSYCLRWLLEIYFFGYKLSTWLKFLVFLGKVNHQILCAIDIFVALSQPDSFLRTKFSTKKQTAMTPGDQRMVQRGAPLKVRRMAERGKEVPTTWLALSPGHLCYTPHKGWELKWGRKRNMDWGRWRDRIIWRRKERIKSKHGKNPPKGGSWGQREEEQTIKRKYKKRVRDEKQDVLKL